MRGCWKGRSAAKSTTSPSAPIRLARAGRRSRVIITKVSHNASNTEPAKLLAIFVVDTSDREIVIPDK